MAYDPEARDTSNSAMIIAIVVLVLVVGAAVAYFATRGNDVDVVTAPGPSNTTIVEKTENVVPVPGSAPPPVVITPGKTTRIEKNTTRETTRTVPSDSADGGSAAEGGSTTPGASSNTNVTVNTAPPADGGATKSD